MALSERERDIKLHVEVVPSRRSLFRPLTRFLSRELFTKIELREIFYEIVYVRKRKNLKKRGART